MDGIGLAKGGHCALAAGANNQEIEDFSTSKTVGYSVSLPICQMLINTYKNHTNYSRKILAINYNELHKTTNFLLSCFFARTFSRKLIVKNSTTFLIPIDNYPLHSACLPPFLLNYHTPTHYLRSTNTNLLSVPRVQCSHYLCLPWL